ncbi:MAG: hypothetical protein ACR2QZ_11185 [Woeseiaceae bacterium]
MSNRPENRVENQQVSDAYRELATERAPDHLNDRILRMAARGRTPYAHARAWMRPAAWAATIGLSLAIVLELNQVPPTDPATIGVSAPADDSSIDSRQSLDADTVPGSQTDMAVPPPPAATETADRNIDTERKRPAPPATLPLDPLSKEELAPRQATVVQEAEDMARARAGSDQGPESAAAEVDYAPAESTFTDQAPAELAATRRDEADRLAAKQVAVEARSAAATFAAISDAETRDGACTQPFREMPESWIACIRELRERGEDELADSEYKEFQRVFPDFDDSVTDK